MRDMIYILGIVLGVGFAYKVGEIEGRKAIPAPIPLEVNLDKQCVAWFFDSNLKAAKKRICGSK